jgi:hypothetical protein
VLPNMLSYTMAIFIFFTSKATLDQSMAVCLGALVLL